MKKLLLLLLFASSFAIAQTKRHAPSIQVAIHPNVELLGFAYFLGYEGAQSHTAGYSERTRQRYAYGIDLYHRYQSYENSQHLATVIRFAENIWLDYFINLLVQLEDFPNARLHEGIAPAYYLRFSQSGDPAEAKHHATQFLDAMNALYREVDFGTYLTSSNRLYASAVTQVRNGLPDSTFLPAVESFYQAHFTNYQLVPSLTLPAGMGFGARYSDKANRHALHVFGTFAPPH